eukprot:352199-Chlamydomonas_euryale.AAC.7
MAGRAAAFTALLATSLCRLPCTASRLHATFGALDLSLSPVVVRRSSPLAMLGRRVCCAGVCGLVAQWADAADGSGPLMLPRCRGRGEAAGVVGRCWRRTGVSGALQMRWRRRRRAQCLRGRLCHGALSRSCCRRCNLACGERRSRPAAVGAAAIGRAAYAAGIADGPGAGGVADSPGAHVADGPGTGGVADGPGA